ncbi:hypothetical protein [Clostridium sp. LIBA-8841]|uniref:hypothetical protein n=1 Tax=Clostridium sp. LIBA-8841 TaxID=2987530 RepID=UPI002AC6F0E7|nr:hypothetical protein [Clostridium sp. LIBA-8841]MDZ5254055.1 hypothetical protein [Clostridium sp. LIBA-8841]
MSKVKELEKIICVTDNLYMDWKCEEISRNEYARMKSRFEIKAEEIRQIISNIETEIQLSSKGVGEDDPYLKTFLKYKNIKELK